MAEPINPIKAELKLAQLLGDDFLAQAPAAAAPQPTTSAAAAGRSEFTGNLFEDILSKSIEALNGVSQSEFYANQLIDRYVRGQADLQEVMVAQSKMNVMVQLATTTINNAVQTFKEITSIQI